MINLLLVLGAVVVAVVVGCCLFFACLLLACSFVCLLVFLLCLLVFSFVLCSHVRNTMSWYSIGRLIRLPQCRNAPDFLHLSNHVRTAFRPLFSPLARRRSEGLSCLVRAAGLPAPGSDPPVEGGTPPPPKRG